MSEYCTCGALLVEDARFCHRCGRPTREEPRAELPPEMAAPPAPPLTVAQRLGQLPMSFANPIALRIAFMVAMLTLLVQNIPGVQLLFIFWWLAGGFAAVLWYRRLTGVTLVPRAGARLGVITGIMVFAAMLVEVAIEVLLAGGEMFEQLRQQQDPRVAQLMKDPSMLAGAFLVMLIFMFGVVVGLCAAGGALGSRSALRRKNA